jgi:hypothetical protein
VTRKDYVAIARALADQYPLDQRQVPQWERDVEAIADTLSDLSGYDANGNRRFDRDRFMAAVTR